LHYEQGHIWERALLYLKRAGNQAAIRSAHREAAGFFERALVALELVGRAGLEPATNGLKGADISLDFH
jgi:hypothetical protein